jgi:hypothetical protein
MHHASKHSELKKIKQNSEQEQKQVQRHEDGAVFPEKSLMPIKGMIY